MCVKVDHAGKVYKGHGDLEYFVEVQNGAVSEIRV